jgi:hypothetical protein
MKAFEIYPEPDDFDSIPKGRRIPREHALALAGELGYWKRRYRSDYVVGGDIQKRLMPLSRPATSGIGQLGHSASKDLTWTLYLSQGGVLPGVYANLAPIGDGRFAFIFSEASGRLSAAALLSAYVAGLFESHIAEQASQLTPEGMAKLQERINDNIVEKDIPAQFVSVLLGLIDPTSQSLTLSAAAACRPLLWRSATGAADVLSLPPNPAAGVFPLEMISSRGQPFAPLSFSLSAGDLFLVGSTDLSGSIKPRGYDDKNRNEFGNERILTIMNAVIKRERLELDLALSSGEKIEFDFSAVADPATDVPLALASAEAIFHQDGLSRVTDPLSRLSPKNLSEVPRLAAARSHFRAVAI